MHSNSTKIGCSFRSIYIQPEIIGDALAGSDARHAPLPFFAEPVIFDEEIIAEYLKLHYSDENHNSQIECETSLLHLIQKLVQRYADHKIDQGSIGRERAAVRKVRDYIVVHYNRNISLNRLSEITNLSAFHINRVFSNEVGMPPHAFQMQVRIAKAKKLIKNGVPLSTVAVSNGFADQSHFNRHFKRLMKITPGEYQNQ